VHQWRGNEPAGRNDRLHRLQTGCLVGIGLVGGSHRHARLDIKHPSLATYAVVLGMVFLRRIEKKKKRTMRAHDIFFFVFLCMHDERNFFFFRCYVGPTKK